MKIILALLVSTLPLASSAAVQEVAHYSLKGAGGIGFILGQSGNEWTVLVGEIGFTTLAKVQPETWTHLAIVKSGGLVSGWVNGQKICGLPDLGGGVQNFSIGATAPGRESFKGWVAEVRYSTFKPGQFDPAADFLLDSRGCRRRRSPAVSAIPTALSRTSR